MVGSRCPPKIAKEYGRINNRVRLIFMATGTVYLIDRDE
jgi:hypothetical protein